MSRLRDMHTQLSILIKAIECEVIIPKSQKILKSSDVDEYLVYI